MILWLCREFFAAREGKTNVPDILHRNLEDYRESRREFRFQGIPSGLKKFWGARAVVIGLQ